MKNPPKTKRNMIAHLIMYSLILCVYIAAAIVLIASGALYYVLSGCIYGIPIIIVQSIICFDAMIRKFSEYSIFEQGINAKYPFSRPMLLRWDELQEVCICRCVRRISESRHVKSREVICFVKKGEEKNGYGRWKMSSPVHYRSVICLDYSPESLEEVASKCPLKIIDLRDTLTYRLDT